jgi:hypothetical protein
VPLPRLVTWRRTDCDGLGIGRLVSFETALHEPWELTE